jgi:formamidopyrimidine-DNA glycosylase
LPEIPDLAIYLEALDARLIGHALTGVRIPSMFLLRTVDPKPSDLIGHTVTGTRRIGKHVVLCFDGDLFAAIHLMISGRLHWKAAGAKLAGKAALAAFDFEHGSLTLTEQSTHKRAGLRLFRGEEALQSINAGGLEPLTCTLEEFAAALTRENHTLKRTLTDPTIFAGIGNAYSDEILHRAKLSPFIQTRNIDPERIEILYHATQESLQGWIDLLRKEMGDSFPERVTAFRPEMAVHGRFGQPCPVCGTPVQRIVYAENEANYCVECQTGGRLLADRALSRLLKDDWPRSLKELEERKAGQRG